MIVGSFYTNAKVLVVPPTLTYVLGQKVVFLTFSTFSPKLIRLQLSNFAKIFSNGRPFKTDEIILELFKMAAQRDFEDCPWRILGVFPIVHNE